MSRRAKASFLFIGAVLILISSYFYFAPYLFMQQEELEYKEIIDSVGRHIRIPVPLTKVAVSNPYTAELITAVGAVDAIVGIDQPIFDNREGFPRDFTKDMIIGGYGEAQLNLEKILLMKPQALIVDGGFQWPMMERILGLMGIEVIVLRADSAAQFYDNCHLVGTIFGKEVQAQTLSLYIKKQQAYVENQLQGVPWKKVYYEVRREGRIAIPGEPFYEMLAIGHGESIFTDARSIYVNQEYTLARRPEAIIRLSDTREMYSYKPQSQVFYTEIFDSIRTRQLWDTTPAIKDNQVLLYSYYSHGGAGKIIGGLFLAKYLYPEYLPDLQPEEVFRVWSEEFQGVPCLEGHIFKGRKLDEY